MRKLMTIILAFATAVVFAQCEPVTYAGKTYQTVQIGNQCWFKENINVGTMIPFSQAQTNNGTIQKWCYGNLESNCDEFGAFYQFGEAVQYNESGSVKGICPDGWRVPTYLDYVELINSVGGADIGGANLKEAGYEHWDRIMPWKPNDDIFYAQAGRGDSWKPDNESGFTALGAGYVTLNRSGWIKKNAYFWTSTVVRGDYFHPEWPDASIQPIQISLIYSYPTIARTTMYRHTGSNVRCIKN